LGVTLTTRLTPSSLSFIKPKKIYLKAISQRSDAIEIAYAALTDVEFFGSSEMLSKKSERAMLFEACHTAEHTFVIEIGEPHLIISSTSGQLHAPAMRIGFANSADLATCAYVFVFLTHNNFSF
jgi:hypothetical protein